MPTFPRMPAALNPDGARMAREAGDRVSCHLGNAGVKQATLSIDGEAETLPPSAVALLGAMLDVLGRGDGVALARVGAMISVAEAGELLDESPARMA